MTFLELKVADIGDLPFIVFSVCKISGFDRRIDGWIDPYIHAYIDPRQ